MTGTICVSVAITGRPAFRRAALVAATAMCWPARSAPEILRCAIEAVAAAAIAGGKAPSLASAAGSDPEFGAKSVYNLAIQGDEEARRIFRRFGRYLGILLAGMVNVLNLDMFVIGGGVSSAWDAFAPTMFEEMRERSLVYAATAPEDPLGKEEGASAQVEGRTRRKTIITLALLGSDAGLYGAAWIPTLSR